MNRIINFVAVVTAVVLFVAPAARAATVKYLKGGYPWDTGTVEINGTAYGHTLYLEDDLECGDEVAKKRVNLSRDWDAFRAVIGLRDNSNANAKVLFEVFTDGTLAFSEVMAFGQDKPIKVDVGNVLRMNLRVSYVDEGKCKSVTPAFGKARVIAKG